MSFIPPVFKKIGVSCSDLLSKKYDLHHEVKFVSKADALTLEAAVTGSNAGSVTVKNSDKRFGEGELKLGTDGSSNLKVKFNKFQKGADATINSDGNLEVNYKADTFAVNAKATAKKVAASACIGTDGITFGASTVFTVEGAVKDYNVGTQYSQGDVTLSLTTANKLDDVTVSMFHKYSSAVQWGAQLKLADSTSLTVGTQYGLSKDTTLKGKYGTSGDLTCVVEHKLSMGKLNVCSDLDTTAGLKTKSFGVGFTFGDY